MAIGMASAFEEAAAQVTCKNWNTSEFFRVANADHVRRCLAAGADIRDRAFPGWLTWTDIKGGLTPLHMATALTKDPLVIDVLIEAGSSNISARTMNGATPLHIAAAYNKPNVIDALLARADPQARDEDGLTPLHWAASYNGNPDVIRMLVKVGSDVNARATGGITPLHRAAWHNGNPDVIKALLHAGAKIDARASRSNAHALELRSRDLTALHWAAAHNENPHVVEALLDAGADIHARDRDGATPLHFAAASRDENLDVIKALLEAGADVNVPDSNGATVLRNAAILGLRSDVIELLAKEGADINAPTGNGATVLHLASKYSSRPEIIRALVAAGADVKARDKNGKTPYELAQDNRRLASVYSILYHADCAYWNTKRFFQAAIAVHVKTCLKADEVDLSKRGVDGLTPLQSAASWTKDPDVIVVLLDAGADPKEQNSFGKKAHHYARGNPRLAGTSIYWTLLDDGF